MLQHPKEEEAAVANTATSDACSCAPPPGWSRFACPASGRDVTAAEYTACRLHGPTAGGEIAARPATTVLESRPFRQAACRHRGEESRREVCSTCRGRVEVKVFHCQVHGECTLGTAARGVLSCANCGDYVALAEDVVAKPT
ncbi:MAG TPA: hypothetical protein VGE52_03760 [Pirellulales bacterium]